MNSKKLQIISYTLLIFVILIGCAGTKAAKVDTTPVGKETTISSSNGLVKDNNPQKPAWITEGVSVKDETLYFTAVSTRKAILEAGLVDIFLTGASQALTRIQSIGETNIGSILQGANRTTEDIGTYISTWTNLISNNLKVSGFSRGEHYWEYVETKTVSGVTYHYNIWGKVWLSKKDYDDAVNRTFNSLKDVALSKNDLDAKTKLEEVQKRMWEEISKIK